MDKINLHEVFKRIEASVLGGLGADQLEEFITRYLRLSGRQISFVKREYQQRILQSDARIVVVKKCSQVGISELMIMRNLALMNLREPFNIIHALPTATFAQKVMKTRIDPLVRGSDYLMSRLNKNLDNASVKQIGHSFLYVNGTYGGSATAAISIPADCISVDELNFCDQDVVSNLQSRLTASAYRSWIYVSTPTVPNFGIDAKFNSSKRYFNYCKCNHCNHWFIPNWLEQARIPNWDKPLLSISATDLGQVAWQETQIHCPNCDQIPNLLPEHREWVCENPLDNYEADGFMISPMDAPQIISPADLVSWSTRFRNKDDFINFHLGESAESSDTGINDTDLDNMEHLGKDLVRGFKVFGLDMGTACHLTVASTDGQGKMTIIALHKIHYTELEQELKRHIAHYRPTTIVADSQPYVETIHRLQQTIPNLYGSVYITSRNLEAFKLIDRTEDKQRSLLDVRQVNVNRNLALNNLMIEIRSGNIGIKPMAEVIEFREHLKDMKRQSQNYGGFNGESESGEAESYVWVKTTGNDHYHHSLLYAYIASQMVHHLPQNRIVLPPFVSRFKVKS